MSKNSVIPYFSRFCIVFCIEKLMGKKSKRIASDSVGCCSPFSAVFFFFPPSIAWDTEWHERFLVVDSLDLKRILIDNRPKTNAIIECVRVKCTGGG